MVRTGKAVLSGVDARWLRTPRFLDADAALLGDLALRTAAESRPIPNIDQSEGLISRMLRN